MCPINKKIEQWLRKELGITSRYSDDELLGRASL